jgi:hypothetical protein
MDCIGHLGPYTHLQHLPANLRTKKYVHPLEKPTGLLGNATLLQPDDHVANFVAEFRRDHPEEHKLLDFVNENYTVKTPTCRMEEASKRIRIENLDMLE